MNSVAKSLCDKYEYKVTHLIKMEFYTYHSVQSKNHTEIVGNLPIEKDGSFFPTDKSSQDPIWRVGKKWICTR